MAFTLFNQIRKLTEQDIEATTRFYAESGKYVDYFQKMFGKTDCTEDIYTNFKPDVAASIRTGMCLGLFKHGVMIGCVLSVDWHLYKQDHPTLFDHMFYPQLETTKQMNEYIKDLNKGVYFIYAVLVEESNRCQGIGSQLIQKYTKQIDRNAAVVSDCVYEYAGSMWLKNGYKIAELSPELKLAVKEW